MGPGLCSLNYLCGDTDIDGQHEAGVDQGHHLGDGQLELAGSVVAGQAVEEDGDEVDDHGGLGADRKHRGTASNQRQADTTRSYVGSHHDRHLRLVIMIMNIKTS